MGCKENGIMVVMTALLGFVGMEGVTLQANAQQGPGSSIAVNSQQGKMDVRYTDGKLSADLKDIEINSVLSEIGRVVGARVEIGSGISGKVTTSFQKVTLEDSLEKLISGAGAGIVTAYDKAGTVTLIKVSKWVGTQQQGVVKVRKVREYFSAKDRADGLSMDRVRKLMEIFRDPSKKGHWVVAAKQIMNIKNPEAKPFLKELITHEDDFVWDEAVREYAMLVDAEDADFILELAEDKAWQRKIAAVAIAMPQIDDPRQIPLLIKMVDDSDFAVQDAAIGAAGVKRIQAAVPILEEILKRGQPHTRAAVADALYSITGVKREWKTVEERAKYQERLRQFNEDVIRKTAEYEKQSR